MMVNYRDLTNCDRCRFLITKHIDLLNRDYDCLILEGSNLSGKRRRKVKKALLRFVRNSKTEFCRYFKPLVSVKSTVGKKGTEFVKERLESDKPPL